MYILIAAVSGSIVISALCSLLESVLYSTRLITLEAAAGHGESRARRMRGLKRNVDRPLAAILILNTLANTAGAALAGWAAGQVWGGGALWIFSLGFTAAILVFSEILPKTIGAIHWRLLWRSAVWPLSAMVRFMAPLIWVARGLTRIVTGGRSMSTPVSEEEILAAASLGAQGGEISRYEHELISNIISLEEVRAVDIMTPRTVMFIADGLRTLGQVRREAKDWTNTRVPVFVGGAEDVVGYVTKDRVLAAGRAQDGRLLKTLAQPVNYVPGSANALGLLNGFLRSRRHICLVVDEYGGIMGLVTLEDVLESLVGREIVDETDQVVDLQRLARSRARAVLRDGEND